MSAADLPDEARRVAEQWGPTTAVPFDPATHPPKVPGTGEVFGCEYPERPPAGLTSWAGECRACRLHLAATLHNEEPIDGALDIDPSGGVRHRVVLADGALAMAEMFDDEVLAREARKALDRVRG